ncbi:MAG: mechanosensitive ion channel [Deltaproteobacteria bacterium]|nr:mechanosensitive ion channel [Deltaproteobacteria bacterium]
MLSPKHFIILFLIFLCACDSGINEPGSWDELIKRQHQELIEISKAVDQQILKLPDRLSDLQKHLYLLRSRFEKLMLYFNLRSGNPLVLRDILGALGWFERETNRLILPFQQEKAAIERQLENLTDLSQKFKREKHLTGKMGPQLPETVTAYLKDLTSLQAKLQPLSLKLTQGVDAAKAFILLLKKDQAQIENASNRVLEVHLLKRNPGFFSAPAWVSGVDEARKWASRFGIYLLEPIELRGMGWTLFMSKIALFSLLLLGLSLFFLKRMKKRFESLSHIHLIPSLLCFAVSLGILLGVSSTGLFPSAFFSTTVTVILVYGLISLSRKLRHLFFADQASEPHRLVPLWAAVSTCIMMEAIHIPQETFVPVWAAWLLVLCWGYARDKRKKQGWANISRGILIGAMALLALLALLGWGYLSVLLGMLVLLLSLNVRLAKVFSAGLGRIGSRWQRRKTASDAKTAKPVKGLGFPLIFLTLLLSSFAWIFIFVGGGSLFMEVIRYRVGWEQFTFSIYRVICIFSLMFVVRAGITLARSALAKLPDHHRDLDSGSVQSLDTIVTYMFWSLFALITLGFLGISFRNLAVIAGGLSVGLGFGLQNIVNNFIGGLILLFGRSIQPGDLVEIDNIRGHVRKVTIRNTLVKAFSGATIFVPNALLISQKMINWSHADRRYRQEIKIGVAYGSDVDKVTDLLLTAAKQSAKVLDRPPPRVRFLDFGDNTLVFSLRVWIRGWVDRYADSEVRYHIDRIFRENNIEISFPQLDLHIRSAEGLKDFHQDGPRESVGGTAI